VGCHLVSPLSKGLFDKAIAESDPFTLVMKSEDSAQFFGGYFLEYPFALYCDIRLTVKVLKLL
jgi:hypothetical protein